MCGGEKKRGRKKSKESHVCGEKKKKYYHNIFTINLRLANISEKKIIFLEGEKNNFNGMLKLKSVSIFITIFSQYFHNKF